MRKVLEKCQGLNDPLYAEAEVFCKESGNSTSALQRKFKIGYVRASALHDALLCQGIGVGHAECTLCDNIQTDKISPEKIFEKKKLTELAEEYKQIEKEYGISLANVFNMTVINLSTLQEKFKMSAETAQSLLNFLVDKNYLFKKDDEYCVPNNLKSIFAEN